MPSCAALIGMCPQICVFEKSGKRGKYGEITCLGGTLTISLNSKKGIKSAGQTCGQGQHRRALSSQEGTT